MTMTMVMVNGQVLHWVEAQEGPEHLASLLGHLKDPTTDQLEGWQVACIDQQIHVMLRALISPLWARTPSPVTCIVGPGNLGSYTTDWGTSEDMLRQGAWEADWKIYIIGSSA